MGAATYDETFDAQMHYRELLDSMARPGKMNAMPPVALNLPAGFSKGSAYIAHMLLDSSVTFAAIGLETAVTDYLRTETRGVEITPETADFLFTTSRMANLALRIANAGDLLTPESAATLVVSVDGLANEPFSGSVKMLLRGPGIESESVVYVVGVDRQFFEDRSKKNAEYPLGVDIVLACDSGGSRIVCLPRTTTVVCEA